MSILKTLGISLAANLIGQLANGYGSKLYNWGNNLAQQPMVVPAQNSKEEVPLTDPGFNPLQMIGVEDNNWSRKDLRNFRKNSGMSKQLFRDWQALQLGYQGKNISRKDLRLLKSGINEKMGDANYANTAITNSWINKTTDTWNKLHPELATEEMPYIDSELAKLDLRFSNKAEDITNKKVFEMIVPYNYEKDPEELSLEETGNDFLSIADLKTNLQSPYLYLYLYPQFPYQMGGYSLYSTILPIYYGGFNYNPYFNMLNDLSRRYFGNTFGYNKNN